MDTELARTFLEVNRTRHFARAADHLNVTQAAVSARIRQLESLLGVRLFTRARNDIRLTPAGVRFEPYANAIVTAWNHARQQVAVVDEDRRLLTIGGLPSLWDIVLDEWLFHLLETRDDLLINAEVLGTDALLPRIREGSLNLGFVYEPVHARDLIVRETAVIELVLVSAAGGATRHSRYVYVDWGTSFAAEHVDYTRQLPNPTIRVDSGRVAYDLLNRGGGLAYLPRSMVAADLARGAFREVAEAPVITRPVHAVYSRRSDRLALIESACDGLPP